MAGPARVVGPDGKVWTVRRRWFPWRRALSLRALWHSTPDEPAEEPSESTGPENPVLAVIGVLLWLVITAGKAVEQEHRFVRTEFADGFDAAAALRDELSTQIQHGELVAEPLKP